MFLNPYAPGIPIPPPSERKKETVVVPVPRMYRIIISGTPENLSAEIERRMRFGWVPYGQPVPYHSDAHRYGIAFMQAIVKYKKEEEDEDE